VSEWGDEWMEQEIIIKWCEKHGLKVGAKEKELMEIFTNIRINNICQLQAAKARADGLEEKLSIMQNETKNQIVARDKAEARVAELVGALDSCMNRLKFLGSDEAKYYSCDNSFWIEEAEKALAKAKESDNNG